MENFQQRPARHQHSMGMIQLFLQLVLRAATGLRGAAAALDVMAGLFPTDEQPPSPNGGQWWLLRLGLYELTRPKLPGDDWVWIIDHTIQIGKVKCLIVVGVRLSQWEAKRHQVDQTAALTHQDLTAFAIEPMTVSNAETVNQTLETLSQTSGILPRQILSDQGSDLLGGAALFRQNHPQTTPTKDIAHFVATVVKKELKADFRWKAFLGDVNQTRLAIQQTPLACLLPVRLKSKARYMNLEELIRWARNGLDFLAHPRDIKGVEIREEELQQKLGWLHDQREAINEWSHLLEVTAACLEYVRQHGYHTHAEAELKMELGQVVLKEGSASMAAKSILAFVKDQSALAPAGERWIGSSECLESLIGKSKQLEGQQSKSGFTKMILGTAAAVSDVTRTTIHAALSATKVKDVIDWVSEHLGPSVQSQRRQAFTGTKVGTNSG